MLAISGNVNYYRISPQFAITNVFCVQNVWPFDALLFSTEDDVINDLLSCESWRLGVEDQPGDQGAPVFQVSVLR